YRVALVRLAANPEHHASTLALGDTVSDELLDTPDDVDEFTLSAPPGTELALFLRGTGGAVGVLAETLEPATKDTIRTITSSGWTESTGRFQIPASGGLLIR